MQSRARKNAAEAARAAAIEAAQADAMARAVAKAERGSRKVHISVFGGRILRP